MSFLHCGGFLETVLKNVADIQTGFSFRGRLEYSDSGNVRVIQMKDLNSDNIVDCHELIKIDMDEVKKHHLVKKDDLVFRSRGINCTASILLEEIENTVVSAPLLKIRVADSLQVFPEYLKWFINQPESQKFLQSRLSGTHGGMIRSSELAELPVSVPDLKTQKLIVEITELSAKEHLILSQISELKKDYISKLLINSAKGE
jgi:restriction endonuclease S subunit